MAGFWHCLRRTYGLKLIATADHEADPFELLTKHEGRAERGGGGGGCSNWRQAYFLVFPDGKKAALVGAPNHFFFHFYQKKILCKARRLSRVYRFID